MKEKDMENYDDDGNCVGFASTLQPMIAGRMNAVPYFFGFLHAIRVVEKYKLGEGKALDLGCGNGELATMMNNNFWKMHYTGMDIVNRGMKDGKWKKFVEADMKKTFPFEDNEFHVAFSIESIEHFGIEDVKHILAEAHRVLKSGGMLVVKTPNAATAKKGQHFDDHPHEFTPIELSLLLVEAGFVVANVYGIHGIVSDEHDFLPRAVQKSIAQDVNNCKWMVLDCMRM